MKNKKSTANCIEVIAVRLFRDDLGEGVKNLFSQMKTYRKSACDYVVEMSLQYRINVASDWGIHIYRNDSNNKPEKSGLGLQIAKELAAYGLVYHEVWHCLDITHQ